MTLLARLEAFVKRVASKPYADTADVAEARALLALLRGEGKDAR